MAHYTGTDSQGDTARRLAKQREEEKKKFEQLKVFADFTLFDKSAG